MRKNKVKYALLLLSSLVLLQCGKKESAAARDVEVSAYPEKVFVYTSPRSIYELGSDGTITTTTVPANSFEFGIQIVNGLAVNFQPKEDSLPLVISNFQIYVSGSYKGKSFEEGPITPDFKKTCSAVLAFLPSQSLARVYYAVIPRGAIFRGYNVTLSSCLNYVASNAAPELYLLSGLPKTDGSYRVKVVFEGWFTSKLDLSTQDTGTPVENFKKIFYFNTQN